MLSTGLVCLLAFSERPVPLRSVFFVKRHVGVDTEELLHSAHNANVDTCQKQAMSERRRADPTIDLCFFFFARLPGDQRASVFLLLAVS